MAWSMMPASCVPMLPTCWRPVSCWSALSQVAWQGMPAVSGYQSIALLSWVQG